MSASAAVPVIVCACDNRYAMPLTVMLKSLTANLKKYDHVIAYILDDRVRESFKELLTGSLDPERITIRWVAVHDDTFKSLKTSYYHARAVYSRLMIPQLLPETVKKAIYLDCDILVLGDIGELWDTDTENTHLAAVPDMHAESMFVSSPLALRLYRELNIPATNKYFNSGVLMLNLAKWREDGISDKILQYLRLHKKDVLWHDQDGLNAVLFDKWQELDPAWNAESLLFECRSRQDTSFSRQEFDRLRSAPALVHFTGFIKPWHSVCRHPKKKLFLDYLHMTLWSGPGAPRMMQSLPVCGIIRYAWFRVFHFQLTLRVLSYHGRNLARRVAASFKGGEGHCG